MILGELHMKSYKRIVIGLINVVAISGLILCSARTHAEDNSVVDDVSIAVPFACTMTGTVISGDEHIATLQPGTYSGASGSEYENGIGKTTLTTYCNDNNGFSIYAIGFTGDSYDGENHTKLVGTTASGNATIATKVYESSDTTSNWSMKVTKVENPTSGDPITYNPQNMTITNSFNNWHVVPDTYTKVAEYKAATGTSTTDTTLGAKVETTYVAYVSTSQPADTYTGKVKYTMVHPYTEEPLAPQSATPGCINYFANASDAVGTMGCQSATDDGNLIDLLASNFSRTGYGFAGWSDSFDYATNPSAHFYGPMETITVPTGTTANGLSLYAVWIKSEGSLQDTDKVASVCSRLTAGATNLTSVSALTDQRDNNTYAIAKLADGNCWMIENLRLESTAEHNSDGTLAQGYGGQFAGLANPETADKFSGAYSANSLYSSDGVDGTTNIGTSNSANRMPRYNNINTPANVADRPQNPTSNDATNNTTNAGMYSYGNYYTWHAAIADTTHYTSGDHNTTSICPAGWQLPLGNISTGDIAQGAADVANKVGGFSYLDRKMGGTGQNQSATADSLRWRKYPANFVYSGGAFGSPSEVKDRGLTGFYWSSTANSFFVYSNNLLISDDSVNPTASSPKFYGWPIRCVSFNS